MSKPFYTASITAYWGKSPEEFTVLAGLSPDRPPKNKKGEDNLIISIVQGKDKLDSLGKAYTYCLELDFLDQLSRMSGSGTNRLYLDMGSGLFVKASDLIKHVIPAIKIAEKKNFKVPVNFYGV